MAGTSKSGPENLHTLVSVLGCILCFQRITYLPVGFLLLWYSVLCTVESLFLLHLLFIS